MSFLKGMGRNIIILGLVSLLTDLSSQMVFPLIPLFLTSVLGAAAYAVGTIEGAAETTAAFLKVISGYYSDKIRWRKPFVIAGYGLSAVTKPLFAIAATWPFVLLVRIIERIGKGLRNAPRDALIAESAGIEVRGKAYGFHRAMDGIGSVGGAVLAFLLLPLLGYRDVFLVSFIPGILAVLVIFLVREPRPQAKEIRERPKVELHFRVLPDNLKKYVLAVSVFAFGHFGYAFLLLKAKYIGLADTQAILMYILFYAVYVVVSIPSGALSDRIGRKPLLFSGYSLFAAISILLAFTASLPWTIVAFALYGIFFAMIDGVQRAFAVDLAPAGLKATTLGVFHTAIALVALPGGFVAGWLWTVIAPQATFLFGVLTSVISIALLTAVRTGK